MDLDLAGRVVLVTGGSRGIGEAAAVAFAAEGAHVALTYRSERGRADAVVAKIVQQGGQALALGFDLERPESIYEAVQTVLDRWDRLDSLVNNAVVYGSRPVWDPVSFEHIADWNQEFRANSEGPFVAIQAALRPMRAQGWGRIVTISSEVAEDGVPGRSFYGAAKAALHGITKTLYKELGPAGILINVVMPGPTLTERMSGQLPAEVKKKWEDASPIRRLLEPKEVVPTVVFLASGANVAVTGEIIRASGGRP